MDYLLHLVIVTSLYAILAWSLDLIVGHTGYVSIAHASVFGIGAYAAALSAPYLRPSLLSMVFFALLVGLFVAPLLYFASSRMTKDRYALLTFALQIILQGLFVNLESVTGGPLGIPSIPRPTAGLMTLDSTAAFAIVAVFSVGIAWMVVTRVTTGAYGRAIHAIRDDEGLLLALGRNPLRFKAAAMTISCSLAAFAGELYAAYYSFVDPTGFVASESILLLVIVIVGGAGSRMGPLAGAGLLVLIPESLRLIGISSSAIANLRQIIFGLFLVGVIVARPKGLLGRFDVGR